MSLASFAFAAALVSGITAQAGDVHAVLARPRLRMEAADYRATGRLVRVEAGGARTSYAIRLKAHWFPDGLFVLLEIDSPAKARAHVLLQMRPGGQMKIEVAHPGDATPVTLPFDRWDESPVGGPGGAELSYEDLLEPQYFWKNQSLAAEANYGARTCDVLESAPDGSDHTHDAGVRTWLDQRIGFPVYVEKTLKGSHEVKEFTSMGLRQNGGVWWASEVEAKVRGRAGSTLLIIERGSTKANLELRDFSPEQLTHFQG